MKNNMKHDDWPFDQCWTVIWSLRTSYFLLVKKHTALRSKCIQGAWDPCNIALQVAKHRAEQNKITSPGSSGAWKS